MLFLVNYNRSAGALTSIDAYRDEDLSAAEESRLELELRTRAANVDAEVVLLQAADELALRLTHRRYFESMSELVTSDLLRGA